MHETAMTSNQYLFPAVSPVAETTALPSFAAPAVPSSTGRYWRTLRHLRLSQLLYLGLHRTLGTNDIRRWPEASTGIKAHGGLRHMAEWQPELAREVILAGNVQFVDPLPADDDVSWSLKEVRHRQIFHANYCDFLNIDLTSPDDGDLLRRAINIALSWCDQNPTGSGTRLAAILPVSTHRELAEVSSAQLSSGAGDWRQSASGSSALQPSGAGALARKPAGA